MDWTFVVIALAAASVWVAAVSLGFNPVRVLAVMFFVFATVAAVEAILLLSQGDPHGFRIILAFGSATASIVSAVCGSHLWRAASRGAKGTSGA